MPAKKTKPKQKKVNKKKILVRLVLVPATDKRLFYMREMHFLNILCERYSEEFMEIVSFDKQFDSLAYLVSEKLKELLDQKFRAFNFVVDTSRYETYNLTEKCDIDALINNKSKTIKDFLNE